MRIYRIPWNDGLSTVVVVHFEADAIHAITITGHKGRVSNLAGSKSMVMLDKELRAIARAAQAKIEVREG